MTTMTTLARIDKAAKDHGWTLQQGVSFARNGKVWLLRGNQQVMVRFSKSGAVLQVRYGLFGGTEITGQDKAGQLIELLSKDAPKPMRPMGPDDAPHCRTHIVFRSDCAECRSEREFGS